MVVVNYPENYIVPPIPVVESPATPEVPKENVVKPSVAVSVSVANPEYLKNQKKLKDLEKAQKKAELQGNYAEADYLARGVAEYKAKLSGFPAQLFQTKYYINPSPENKLIAPLEVSKTIYDKLQKDQTSQVQSNIPVKTEADKLIEKNLPITKLANPYMDIQDKVLLSSYAPTSQNIPRYIASEETRTIQPGSNLQNKPVESALLQAQMSDEKRIEEVKRFESGKSKDIGKFYASAGILFTEGVGEGFVQVLNPLNVAKATYQLLNNPSEALQQARESFQYNEAGFLGNIIGQSLAFETIGLGLKPIAREFGNINPYSRQSVVLSVADTFGEKGLTPVERSKAFSPALEIPRLTLETEYGTIEIIKNLKTEDIVKPSQVSKSYIEQVPEDISPPSSKPSIPRSKIDLSGESVDLSQKGKYNFLKKGLSLDRRAEISLDTGGGQLLVLEPEYVATEAGLVYRKVFGTELNLDIKGKVTESRFGLNVLFVPKVSVVEKPATINTPALKNETDTFQSPIFDLSSVTAQEPRLKSSSRQSSIPVQQQDQVEVPKVTPVLEQEQVQRTVQRVIPDLALSIEELRVVPEVSASKKSASRLKLEVRRKGKFRVVDFGENVEALQERGKSVLRESLAASFRITDVFGKPLNLPVPVGFTTAKRDRSIVVQPRGQRLATFGERKEIKEAKKIGRGIYG